MLESTIEHRNHIANALLELMNRDVIVSNGKDEKIRIPVRHQLACKTKQQEYERADPLTDQRSHKKVE